MRGAGPGLGVRMYGASGDLTVRKLVPALFHLFHEGLLPQPFVLLGVSRTEFTDESFREKVVFAVHNLAKDPPFTRMDLVSCRNLLIYLQPAAQRRVLTLLHFGLRRDLLRGRALGGARDVRRLPSGRRRRGAAYPHGGQRNENGDGYSSDHDAHPSRLCGHERYTIPRARSTEWVSGGE